MRRESIVVLALCVAAATAVGAQPRAAAPQARPAAEQPKPAPQTAKPAVAAERPPEASREPQGQATNIKVDITITDQGAPGEPSKKTVSMIVADRYAGSVRTAGTQIMTATGPQPLVINVDATPTLLKDGSIRLMFGLEYQPRAGNDGPATANGPQMPTRVSQINERLTVIVQDGKQVMISQAADAGSDRKVTVELKATIVK